MRGPKLQEMIDQGRLGLPHNTSVEDFETLYNLVLESRGVRSLDDLTQTEEVMALGILCRIPIMGKLPSYNAGICALLSNYSGVSKNERLREKFRRKLSPRATRAATVNDVPLARLRGVFKQGNHTKKNPEHAT